MGAAEGQKRSYVEMILCSQDEVKLRCDKEWTKRNRGKWCHVPPRPAGGGGETSREPPPHPPHFKSFESQQALRQKLKSAAPVHVCVVELL